MPSTVQLAVARFNEAKSARIAKSTALDVYDGRLTEGGMGLDHLVRGLRWLLDARGSTPMVEDAICYLYNEACNVRHSMETDLDNEGCVSDSHLELGELEDLVCQVGGTVSGPSSLPTRSPGAEEELAGGG